MTNSNYQSDVATSEYFEYILDYFKPFRSKKNTSKKKKSSLAYQDDSEITPELIVPLKQYVIAMAVGSVVFTLIAASAIGLSAISGFLADSGVSPIIVYSLKIVELVIFGVDLLLAIIFIGKSSYKVTKDL